MNETDLYTTHAKDFSDSRQAPWPGWKRVMELDDVRKLKDDLRILDLGCGNGRFLKYIIQNPGYKIQKYLGVDYSDILLNIAKKNFEGMENVNFLKLDLNNPSWINEVKNNSLDINFIAAFGIIHHINSFSKRKNILQYAYNLLPEGGIFAIAFWQVENKERYKDKLTPAGGEHDYIMKFGSNGATRFVHHCTEDEIAKLEEGIGFKVVDSYYSDGKEGDQNLYKIYKK